ncbi:MAG: hypothetical protein ACUVUT_00050 [Candidatus Bipolaricaulia bacterium]
MNLYYHLQMSCGTNPYLKNERYQKDFRAMIPKGLCWDFRFAQDQYWFMQRFFIETLGRAQDLSSLEEGFARGLEGYAREELIPELASILKRAHIAYEPYWRERWPELKKLEQEIEAAWRGCEEGVFAKIVELTKLAWTRELYIVNMVDSLGYGGLIFGEGHYAIGACDSKTFLHILIHELIHDNIKPAVRGVHKGLSLSQDQEDALDETFARLIEMEVTRSIVPWAEESLEQKREEAKGEGFLEFFEAMLCDWPGYIVRLESYSSIEAFMKEEALKRERELELAKPLL